MKLSQFKNNLSIISDITIYTADGEKVPRHFHITEAGLTTKTFIDCGGTLREEKVMNFQVWVANDTEHRLVPEKLLKIISIAESHFGNNDLEVEIEYQTNTVGRYGIDFQNNHFVLLPKQTDCLAKENCDIPVEKKKLNLSSLTPETVGCCSTEPGNKCC